MTSPLPAGAPWAPPLAEPLPRALCTDCGLSRMTIAKSCGRACQFLLPLRRMPNFLRPLMGCLMPRIGPRGLEFARARVEMKAVETVLYLRHAAPRRLRAMVPPHAWALVARYGLARPPITTPRATPRPGAQTMPQTVSRTSGNDAIR